MLTFSDYMCKIKKCYFTSLQKIDEWLIWIGE